MKDVNYPIRKAYVSALTGLEYDSVSVPVYYQIQPDNAELYIIIEGIRSGNSGTMNTQETDTTVTLSVHSSGVKYNSGKAVDEVAGLVLEAILPSTSGVLDLSDDDLQMTSATLVSDNTTDFTSNGAKIYIDRTLVFNHNIFQK